MEYLFILIILAGSLFGLYFLIKKQIENNSKESKKEIESKLDSLVDAFKLESAKNLADQIKDSNNLDLQSDVNIGVQNKNEDNFEYAETIEEEETLSLHDKEVEMIKQALIRTGGRRKNAATELGISERTLYRKIKQHNLGDVSDL